MRMFSVTVVVMLLAAPAGPVAQELATKPCGSCPSDRRLFTEPQLRAVVDRDAARMRKYSAGKAQQSPRPHDRGWVRRHPALLGALIGAGVGVGVNFAADNWNTSGCKNNEGVGGWACLSPAVPPGLFAGLGSIVGFVISKSQ
jgi:hypothetical protein